MGWFDFLKKKKPERETDSDGKTMGTEDVNDSEKTAKDLENAVRKALSEEYTSLMILDNVYANPLIFLHEKKAQQKYIEKLKDFMNTREGLKEYWSREGNEVIPALERLLNDADQFAAERGLEKSPRSSTRWVTWVIFAALFGLIIISNFIPVLAGASFYIMMGGLCVSCMLPQYLRKAATKKVLNFQEQHMGEFIKNHSEDLDIIHDAAQYLLMDLREVMIDNGLAVGNRQFQLLNSDYKGIKVIRSGKVPQRNSIVYVCEFLGENEDPNEYVYNPDVDPDVDYDVEPISVDELDQVDDLDDIDYGDDEDESGSQDGEELI